MTLLALPGRWPHFDREVYTDNHMPIWDHHASAFADPDTGRLLPSFDDALALMDEMDDIQPAHVIRWGVQADTKDIGDDDDGTTLDADGERGPVALASEYARQVRMESRLRFGR
ncbi:hypothetical protein OIE68_45145 [Nocardia vinacea]|uniref:hypothetical protein n=1 Tax=Nocardia vinacea TaxID=96468 RepID=UPI002E123942|nr:hypothetical protein OIE68_45145 [Nocardia vinacea]